jgi:hypothetical protein
VVEPASPGAQAGAAGKRQDEGLQKINLKLHLEAPGLDADFLLAVFGRWREEKDQEIVDLADYAHVEEGPGVLLISHRWHFGLDFADGKPGLFYGTRKGLEGPPAARLATALEGLIAKSRRLATEKEFPPAARARCGEIEVVLNDRLLAPNTDASHAVWGPAVAEVFGKLYAPAAVAIEPEKDPARRLAYAVRAAVAGWTLDTLAGKAGGLP